MVREVSALEGDEALVAYTSGRRERPVVALAVRYTLQVLAKQAPGRSVEVRVPPFGAVQCIAGPIHTRGTPANVVETSPQVWLALVTGDLTWDQVLVTHQVSISGQRADLSGLLPLRIS